MNKAKPFLKWPGNKYRCIEQILGHLAPAKRLIEPFTGSGAVFLNTSYPTYLLAEKNADLILLFKCLQSEGGAFIDYCADFFSCETNSEIKYYQLRHHFNTSMDAKYKAALFLYLNRHGYNGLCRYNQQKIYNVPFGQYKKPYFPRKEMTIFYQKSQSAEFITSDFRETFALAKPGDVIYCDPPYVPLSITAKFVSYTYKPFHEADQLELVSLATKSASAGIPVIISNHDTPFTRYHYRQADIVSFPVRRSINCDARQRHYVQELVAVFR